MSSKRIHPRTEWVHALRAYFDAQPEQLALFDVPEPPGSFPERAFFLVVADYAQTDGSLVMALRPAARRWRISEVTLGRYLRMMVRLGWLVNVGHAHKGQAQMRRLTRPGYSESLPTTTERGIAHDTPKDGKGVSEKAPLSEPKGYRADSQRGIADDSKGYRSGTPQKGIEVSQVERAAPPPVLPPNRDTNTPPNGAPPNPGDVTDFIDQINVKIPAAGLKPTKPVLAAVERIITAGGTASGLLTFLQVRHKLDVVGAAAWVADLDVFAEQCRKAKAGPEHRTVAEALAAASTDLCDEHREPAHTCWQCRYPNGRPRDPAIPDRAPVFIPETRAERVARQHAEAEARDEAERAERAARRKAREAALATDQVIGPEKPAGTRPPTEAEVIALAADQAAEQARWANQPADDTDPEQESESA